MAMEAIKQHFTDKDAEWSLGVKIRAGWVCEEPGCGELDKKLLESHHIRPKEKFPKLMYELDNGECDCLWRHAFEHRKNPVVMNMILLRLVSILTRRLYRTLSVCQKVLINE